MRVALTRERIVGDAWDGGGRWRAGEIEDYQLVLPRAAAGASESAAALIATICPPSIDVPSGVLMQRTGCRLVNLGGDGAAELRLTPTKGDATLVPDRFGRLDLRAGAEQTVPLVLVRGEDEGTWRYQTGQQLDAQVADGTVCSAHRPLTAHSPSCPPTTNRCFTSTATPTTSPSTTSRRPRVRLR